jgi:hypothetical protein
VRADGVAYNAVTPFNEFHPSLRSPTFDSYLGGPY